MAKYFRLLSWVPKKGGRKFTPEYHIALPDHSVVDGQAVLTPRMVGLEVDGYIDDLIADLEKIRKEAKKKQSTYTKILGSRLIQIQ